MRVIVTGGAGFIGTNLCKKLIKLGHKVTSIDNYTTGKEENHIEGVKYERQDIRYVYDYKWVYGEHPDVIFHMAAIARIQPSFRDPTDYFLTNANGTLNIVDYCANSNVPLIYAVPFMYIKFTHVDKKYIIVTAKLSSIKENTTGPAISFSSGSWCSISCI